MLIFYLSAVFSLAVPPTPDSNSTLPSLDVSAANLTTPGTNLTHKGPLNDFAAGAFHGAMSLTMNVVNTVIHPMKTLEGLTDAISHPIRTVKATTQAFKDECHNKGKAECTGNAAFQTILLASGTAGLSSVMGKTIDIIDKGRLAAGNGLDSIQAIALNSAESASNTAGVVGGAAMRTITDTSVGGRIAAFTKAGTDSFKAKVASVKKAGSDFKERVSKSLTPRPLTPVEQTIEDEIAAVKEVKTAEGTKMAADIAIFKEVADAARLAPLRTLSDISTPAQGVAAVGGTAKEGLKSKKESFN